jgi:hypothetical protein
MASRGNEDRTAVHDVSLHPCVKLAITFMGLMIAFVIVGLVYYSVNLAYDPAEVASPLYAAYYMALLTIPSTTIALQIESGQEHTYLVFAALAISLSLFIVGQPANCGMRWDVVITLLVPRTLVGVLPSRALKTLE